MGRIIKLATEVRYSLTEIRELKNIGNLSDDQTEKIVMVSHKARLKSLRPLIEVMSRGVSIS